MISIKKTIRTTGTKKGGSRKSPVKKKPGVPWKYITAGVLLLVIAVIAYVVYQPGKTNTPSAPVQTGVAGSVSILPELPTKESDLQARYRGGDGAGILYQWEINGRPVAGEISQLLSKDRYQKGDSVSAIVSMNGKEEKATIVIQNSTPKISAVTFTPEYPLPGSDITASPLSSDADGDNVRFTYQWTVNGIASGQDSPTLSRDAFKKGDRLAVRIVPSDLDGEGPPYQSEELRTGSSPPHFTSSPPADFSGNDYIYQARAIDPDGDVLTYSLAAAPPGMAIDSSSGVVTWKVDKNGAGAHSIEIVAKDPDGFKAIQKYTLAISISEGVAQ